MFKLDGPQLRDLRKAIEQVHQGGLAAGRFAQFLFERFDIQLSSLTTDSAPFPRQLFDALVAFNSGGRILELVDGLEKEYPGAPDLAVTIAALRRASSLVIPSRDAVDRLNALKNAHLLLDGLPFINRKRLREIMSELLDPFTPARVGVVAGSALTGKSWSLHLIRAFCKTQQPKVRCIVLDLEVLQPGNDPVILWEELVRQLSDRPAPAAPREDTKGGQYVDRLVVKFAQTWEDYTALAPEEQKPCLLIVFDNLDKNAEAATAPVGPSVVDFAEALALAAVTRRLEGRVLLLGFPRGFSPPSQLLSLEEMAPREQLTLLTLDEVKGYLTEVGIVIGRGVPRETEDMVSQALSEAAAKSTREERRFALTRMSAKISHHVNALAKA